MEDYKVQVSLSAPPKGQYQKGAMLNIRGGSVDEVKFHLAALYGEPKAAEIMDGFVTAEAVQTVTQAFPGTTQVDPTQGSAPVAQPAGTVPGAAPNGFIPPQGFVPPAGQSFGAPAPVAQPPAQGAPAPQQGQTPGCQLCGKPKNQVNGKHGLFWSCPDWADDRHKAAKAQGFKF